MSLSSHPFKAPLTALLGLLMIAANAQSPTAPALDFNVFLQNSAKLVTNETEGPIAMGGNLTLAGSYRVANSNAGTFKVGNLPIGLLIGGRVVYTSGNETYVNNGYVKIGKATGSRAWYKDSNNANSNVRVTPGGYGLQPSINLQANASSLGVSETNNPVFQSGLIDFVAAFSTLQANARNMSAYATNIALTNPNGNITGTTIPSVLTNGQLKVNLKTGVNVLNVTGAELNSVTGGITFTNAPDASHVLVINVNAAGLFNWNVWNQAGVSLQHAPYILYNFYNTTALQIQGAHTIEGTVFAPFADITKTANTANIEGQVIGLSFYHAGGENHYARFLPSLPNTNLAAVSQPAAGPTTAVTANKTINSFTLSWTRGNGAARIVVARKGGPAGGAVNNTTYTANPKFGLGSTVGGGYVVYNGTGTSVTVTSLESNTLYYFTVIEYNTGNSQVVYNNSAALSVSTTTLADADGDGIADADDAFPNDATKAFSSSYPVSGFGTLLYEDLWPYKGDYDFNDLVVDYRFNTITNAANNVTEIEYFFAPRAAGATNRNAFAFQLDGVAPAQIASVSGSRITGSLTTLGANGTEAGQSASANIIVFDDAVKVFKNAPQGVLNTLVTAPAYSADTIKVVVKFVSGGVSYASLTPAKFNPYLIVNQSRGKEVHLPNRLPSAKVDASLFGKGDDNSIAGQGRYYKTATNLPWALDVNSSIPYPQENVDFTKAYLNFIKWASSGGTINTDWYLNTAGNRDASRLYTR